MTSYNTKVLNVGDLTVTLSKAKSPSAGDRLEYLLKLISHVIVDPGYGQGGKPVAPDNALPGKPPGSAEQPGIDNSLPGKPPGEATQPRPDQGLPGSQPGVDNDLPGFIHDNAKAIAKAVLNHCVDCNTAQPKK